MKSEDYRRLINNERFSSDLTEEEFDNTLMHFAKLYHEEQQSNKGKRVFGQLIHEIVRDNLRKMDEK